MGAGVSTEIEVVVNYTFQDLQVELKRIRGSMPRSTLYYWMDRLGMHPNVSGYYESSDLEILKKLNRFLRKGRSIKQFKELIIKYGVQEVLNAY